MRNSTNLYTIKVTNTGNTTISYPFISVEVNSDDPNFKVSTNIYGEYDKKLCEMLGLDLNDFAFANLENNPSNEMNGKLGVFVVPTLSPYESKELHIQIKSSGNFNISAWKNDYTVKDFEEKIMENANVITPENAKCINDFLDCYGDWMSDVAGGIDIIRQMLDVASQINKPLKYLLLAFDVTNATVSAVNGQAEKSLCQFTSIGVNMAMGGLASLAFMAIGTAEVAAVGYIAIEIALGLLLADGGYLIYEGFRGAKACGELYQICRDPYQNPLLRIGTVNSYDPNDKIGYRSPSGSTYFKEDVTNMTYIINFENDPEKATAAAQDVYITDTLNITKFDINSFRAGYVRVSDKIKQAAYDVQNHTWDGTSICVRR